VFHVCAPRARATSLSARPMGRLPCLLNGPARRDVGATRGNPPIAGGAYIVFHVCASRARAASLSARPMGGLPCLLNGPARRDVGATRGVRKGDPAGKSPRVAHTLRSMYAPHEHAQHPCQRVLCVACLGFSTVADIKGDVGATCVQIPRVAHTSRRFLSGCMRPSVCCHHSILSMPESEASFQK